MPNEYYRLCTNKACERAIKSTYNGARQANYCCAKCSHADEHSYEIESHTVMCDGRWKDRREYRRNFQAR